MQKHLTKNSSLFCRVDPYGFERPDDFDYASYEAFFSRYLVVLTRRAIKWSKLLKGNNSVQKSLKGELYMYL